MECQLARVPLLDGLAASDAAAAVRPRTGPARVNNKPSSATIDAMPSAGDIFSAACDRLRSVPSNSSSADWGDCAAAEPAIANATERLMTRRGNTMLLFP